MVAVAIKEKGGACRDCPLQSAINCEAPSGNLQHKAGVATIRVRVVCVACSGSEVRPMQEHSYLQCKRYTHYIRALDQTDAPMVRSA